VSVARGNVLVAGGPLIIVPDPAPVLIPFGLALLATELPWTRGVLRYVDPTRRQSTARGSTHETTV
jgi:hypothetical protein